MDAAPRTPLPYRIRGLEWLLAVGVVLVATAGAALTAVFGGNWVQVLLLGLAAAAALASWAGAVAVLPRSEEAFAAAAVALAAIGVDPRGPALTGSVWPPVVVGAVFGALAYLLPRPATWPLATWAAAQVTVLRATDGVPTGLPYVALAVGTALAGVATAWVARPLVARTALVTALPWWTAGVVTGVAGAWTGAGPGRWVHVVLVSAAAVGLVAASGRATLRSLLRPPWAVPVLAGIAVGATVGAALHSPGPVAVPLAGYLGVGIASAAAALLTGAAREVLLPPVVAACVSLVLLCLGQLLAGGRWTALTALFATAATLGVLTALLRADERPAAVPTAVACGGLAALCTVPPGGVPAARGTAVALTVLYLLSLVVGLAMTTRTRRPTAATGAACAVGATVLLVAVGPRVQLTTHLAVQGACTTAWAWLVWWRARTGRAPGAEQPAAAADAVAPGALTDPAGPLAGLLAAAGTRADEWIDRWRRVRRAAQAAIGVPAPPEQPAAADPDPEPATASAPEPPQRPESPSPPEDHVAAAEASPAWRAGAAQLVVATWIGVDLADWRVLEGYTLPAALGLLVAAGPRVVTERSAPVWGPALWVAAAPSVAWAVIGSGSERPIWLFVVAATVMALGAWGSVRAPLVAGAVTAVTLAVGLLAMQLPLPIGAALVVGAALLGVGTWRESRPPPEPDAGEPAEDAEQADGFRQRLADMR